LFEIDRARTCFERAVAAFAATGQRLNELQTIADQGILAATIGRFAEAIERFEAADAIAVSISYGFGHVACLNNISFSAYNNGDFKTALAAARRALETADEIGAPAARAHAMISAGVAERELGDLEAAVAHLEQGTAIARELNETITLGEDLCELAITFLRRHDLARAVLVAAEILELTETSPQRSSRPQFLFWTVAAVRRAAGDLDGARAFLAQAGQMLDDLEAAIPDLESRRTFRNLRHNRAIDAAVARDCWEV
jgi:tetratricopeptide (TPR) repeat protein